MANTVATPPKLIDSLKFLSGATLNAADLADLWAGMNNLSAKAGCDVVVQNTFAPGLCVSREEVAPDTHLFSLKVPYISDKHTSVTVRVRGYHTAAALGATIEVRAAGVSISAALNEGAPAAEDWITVGSIPIEVFIGEGFLGFYLTVDDSAGFAEIVQVWAEIDAITDNPLPAEAITSKWWKLRAILDLLEEQPTVPFGTAGVTGPDRPLSASRGLQLRNALASIEFRGRTIGGSLVASLSEEYNGIQAGPSTTFERLIIPSPIRPASFSEENIFKLSVFNQQSWALLAESPSGVYISHPDEGRRGFDPPGWVRL